MGGSSALIGQFNLKQKSPQRLVIQALGIMKKRSSMLFKMRKTHLISFLKKTISRLYLSLCLLFLVVHIFDLSLFADAKSRNNNPTQFQLSYGSFGAGLALGHHFNSTLYSGIEYYQLDIEGYISDQRDLHLDGEYQTYELDARLSLFDGSGFYLQGGLAYCVWSTEISGSGRIKDTSFQSTDFDLTVDWPDSAYTYACPPGKV